MEIREVIVRRIPYIDILKCLGILLVVSAHGGLPGAHYFTLFHIAIFFIAAGYCYNEKNSESKLNVGKVI